MKRYRPASILLCTALALALNACSTRQTLPVRQFIAAPERYDNQIVRICGWVRNQHEDWGIWASRSAQRRGANAVLSLDPSDSLPHDAHACIRGRIVRTGCGAEDICINSANVPYQMTEPRLAP